MAAPVVTAVTPLNGATSVVLGTTIMVTFDQLINTATVTDATFSLTGPGQTSILTPDQLIAQDPSAITGREYITGTFGFSTTNGGTQSVVTFDPAKPLQTQQTYTIILLGSQASLASTPIKNAIGEAMVNTYQWSFTTGVLDVITPPVPSPLPPDQVHIDPAMIKVLPRQIVGNDVTQEIDIIFPGPIDPASFNLGDILVSVDAVLSDPGVVIPPTLIASAQVVGNTIKITITGWPVP